MTSSNRWERQRLAEEEARRLEKEKKLAMAGSEKRYVNGNLILGDMVEDDHDQDVKGNENEMKKKIIIVKMKILMKRTRIYLMMIKINEVRMKMVRKIKVKVVKVRVVKIVKKEKKVKKMVATITTTILLSPPNETRTNLTIGTH